MMSISAEAKKKRKCRKHRQKPAFPRENQRAYFPGFCRKNGSLFLRKHTPPPFGKTVCEKCDSHKGIHRPEKG